MIPRAITGIGVASSLGIGRAAFFEGLRAGVRRTAPPETFDGSSYPDTNVAEVLRFDAAAHLGDKGLRSLDRLSKLMVVAARLALHDCGLKEGGDWVAPGEGALPYPERVGLVVSNAFGSLEAITELHRVALLEAPRYINPSRFPLTVSNSAAGYASIWEDLRALNVSVSDGNCGALDAVSCANLLLEGGRADAILVGGAEAMSEALFVGWRRLALRATDPGPGRPILGEGAALMALERVDDARRRNATSLAEVTGYGTAFDPPEKPGATVHPSSRALESAIADALADAQLGPADVNAVVSGIAGVSPFDEAEAVAIRRALGDTVPIKRPKHLFGETFGAGGALGMLAAMGLLLDAAPAAPTRAPVRTPVRTVLVTALGYYGNASALVMRAATG